MTCLFYHPEQTVVTSPDCFRHGSTFATHNTLVQTDTTVHTLPTTNTHHNRRDGTTPWINQHTFNLLLHTLLQFAQGSWSLNFVDPLAGLCGAWWLSTYYTSIFTVQTMYGHKQLFVSWAYGWGSLKERKTEEVWPTKRLAHNRTYTVHQAYLKNLH